jgi:hypothetical protein
MNLENITQIKLIIQNPRIYLSNYFDDLKNLIDLEYFETILRDRIDKNSQVDLCKRHQEITEKLNQVQIECFQNFPLSQINVEIFNQIKTFLNNIESQNIDNLNQSIYENLMKLQKILFSNKSLIFLKKKDIPDLKSFGLLICVEDQFMNNTIIKYIR